MADESSSVIVGIGQTEFSKNSGRSELQLACEAIRAALDDCGLAPADVDGMTTFTLDTSDDVDLVRSLGIENLRFSRNHSTEYCLGLICSNRHNRRLNTFGDSWLGRGTEFSCRAIQGTPRS